MRELWKHITYYRHRSELWALNLAQQAPFMAGFPIFFMAMFWWFMMGMPFALPFVMLKSYSENVANIFLLVTGLPVLLVIVLASRWFFGWYEIAADLMSGGSLAAEKKQQALISAIDLYRATLV